MGNLVSLTGKHTVHEHQSMVKQAKDLQITLNKPLQAHVQSLKTQEDDSQEPEPGSNRTRENQSMTDQAQKGM